MNPRSHSNHQAAESPRFATIEAGGTKIIVGFGESDGAIQRQAEFVTNSPAEKIGQVTSWLDAEIQRTGPLAAIGLSTFCPVQTDPSSPKWGHMGQTPKLLWRGADIVAPFQVYGVPIALDTDVNGAALAEWR
ncbi:MAG: hypothetical protein NVS3B5_03840 [Sphingomicrobium sp.]